MQAAAAARDLPYLRDDLMLGIARKKEGKNGGKPGEFSGFLFFVPQSVSLTLASCTKVVAANR
jgi:hypothetical protein